MTFIMQDYKKHIAFTLAEVLITIGIIGVVAAMTLPTLVNKYKERENVTKVKKFYSVINQALLMAIKDNGYVDEWDFIETDNETGEIKSDKFISYLKPYLKISKDCGAKSGCISNGSYKLLNGSTGTNYGESSRHYKLILADGSYMWIRRDTYNTNTQICAAVDSGYKNVCGVIWIDVNGKNPPNTMGKDTFLFAVLKNRIMPGIDDDCKAGASGWGCAGYILQHGDMKYLYK